MIPAVLTSFLTRLSKREKMVLSVTIIFLSVAFVDRAVIGPVLSRVKLLDEKIAGQEELVRKNVRILAEKDRVEAAIKSLSSYSRKAQTPEEETAYLLGEVEKLARKTSLYIVDMKPLAVQEDNVSRKYAVDLNCEAQMEQIMNFMYEVENSPVLLKVETFNISPKSQDSSIAKVNMRISDVIFL